MVFGVPKELQNEVSLAGYFDSAFDGLGRVQNVVIARYDVVIIKRKWTKIKNAVAQRAKYLLKFEIAYASCVRKYNKIKENIDQNTFENAYTNLGGDSAHESNQDPSSFSDETESILMDLIRLMPTKVRPRHRMGFLGLFGPSVDSLNYYLENYAKWNLEVQSLRRQPEASSASSVAFVTFDSPKTAVSC